MTRAQEAELVTCPHTNLGPVEKKLPWGVILLLGGGFALADITGKSGLSEYMVVQLEWLKELDPLLVSFIIAVVSTFVTEVASNTACANILVPILSKVSCDWRIAGHVTTVLASDWSDVPLALLQPALPNDDLRYLRQLRLHAPRGHGPQRHCVR